MIRKLKMRRKGKVKQRNKEVTKTDLEECEERRNNESN